MKYHAYLLVSAALSSPKVRGLSIQKPQAFRSRTHHHPRLFSLPKPQADTNSDIKSKRPVLKPHAPTTPRLSKKDDESLLQYTNQLLDTQQASKSPTRRIADDEFYQPSPTTNYLQTLDTKVIRAGPRPHATSIELLRDSKRRAQKLLSRSLFEKERAEEKKARIRARVEEELKEVDEGLKAKLNTAFMGIEADVERMQALINREIILEEERMAQFNLLVQNLQSSALAIQKDMVTETKIYHEMKALLSKLDSSASSAQELDKLISRKQELLGIESDLLKDLNACASESKQAFFDCERRLKSMQSVLYTVTRPVQTDWSDIDIMESVLAEAKRDVEESEAHLAELRGRIDFALMQKGAILRENVTIKSRKAGKEDELGMNNNAILKVSDLQDKNDTDVMKQLFTSIGNATYSGSKATALAIKTLLEAASAKEVSMAADLVRSKTQQINFGSNETFKESARAALDSIVGTTKVFFEKAAVSEVGKEAGKSVQNVTDELISAGKAVSVLGGRAYQKLFNQME